MREKEKTGIDGLDKMLNGGIPQGNQVVLAGGPGTGKTLLCMEFLYRGALAGNISVLFSLEETSDMVIENTKAAYSEFTELDRLIKEGKLIIHGADRPPT